MPIGDELKDYRTNLGDTRTNVDDLRGRVEATGDIVEAARRGLEYVDKIEQQTSDFLKTIQSTQFTLKIAEKAGPLKLPAKALKAVVNALEDVTKEVKSAAHKLNTKIEDGKYIEKLEDAEEKLDDFSDGLEEIEKKLADHQGYVSSTIQVFDFVGAPVDPIENTADATVSPLNTVLEDVNDLYDSITSEIDDFELNFQKSLFQPAINVAAAFSGINSALAFLSKPLNTLYSALKPIEGLLDAVGFVYNVTVGPVIDWVLDKLGITDIMDRIGDKISGLLPDADVLNPLEEAIDNIFGEIDDFIGDVGWNTDIGSVVDRITDEVFPGIDDTADGNIRIGTESDGTSNVGDDTLQGRDGVNDFLNPLSGDDVVNGGSGDDIILASEGNDTINGGTGTDRLIMGAHLFTYDFSHDAVTDTFYFNHVGGQFGTEVVQGIDLFVFTNATYTAVQMRDTIKPINGGTVTGSPEDDLMYAVTGAPASTVQAAEGNDTLIGTEFADLLEGQQGNDKITSNLGADTVNGGDGTDTWIYAQNNSSGNSLTSVDLVTGQTWDGHSRDTLTSIENIVINDSRDTDLFGDGGNNTIVGNGSRDWIDGRGGDDSLVGGSGRDLLIGGAGVDTLRGGDHNDTLVAGGTVVAGRGETYDGGTGFDRLVYSNSYQTYDVEPRTFVRIAEQEATGPVRIYAETGRIERLDDTGTTVLATDTAINIESYIGSDRDDTIHGAKAGLGERLNIDGGGGNDILYSNGATQVSGGEGDDLIYVVDGGSFSGGAGTDTLDTRLTDARWYIRLEGSIGTRIAAYKVDESDALSNSSGTAVTRSTTLFSGNLTNTEIVYLGEHDDEVRLLGSERMTIYGGDGDDTLIRGVPNDGTGNGFMYGQGGNDTLELRVAGALHGGTGDDTLTVNASGTGHEATGGDGDDVFTIKRMGSSQSKGVVDGGSGYDVVTIDTPNQSSESNERTVIDLDTGIIQSYATNRFGESVDDVDITITNVEAIIGSQFRDLFIGSDGGERFVGAGGNDTIQGNGDRDELFGGIGDDSLSGGQGDDLLNGGPGNDTLNGGTGTDTASYVNATPTGEHGKLVASDFGGITANLGTGIVTHASGRDTLISIEAVTGGMANDTLIGSANNDILSGADGNDSISGLAGDDVLLLGAGDDFADGGADNDRIVIGTGDATVEGGSGWDILDLGTLNGTVLVNVGLGIYAARTNGQRPVWADDQTTTARMINGVSMTPQDVMEAQAQFSNDIADTTRSTEDPTGLSEIEFETVSETHSGEFTGIEEFDGGIGDDTLEGAADNDSMSGGAGNDILRGNAGNDTLAGGIGNDTVEGGAGNDVLISTDREPDTTDQDRYDGGADNDTLQLSHSVSMMVDLAQGFSSEDGGATRSTLVSIENAVSTGSARDTLAGDAGNNLLSGGAGNDTLIGRDGNDTLIGGANNDLLNGQSVDPDFDPTAGQVYRLYKATLDRTPDINGHYDWIERINDNGLTLTQAANSFVGSREFSISYGQLSNTQFVRQLYNNVLDREADSGGLATWVGSLNNGSLSRAEVVLGFSESQEFVTKTMAESLQYSHAGYQIDWSDDVYRLYRATLDRAPDVGGFSDWTGRLASGAELETTANGFVASQEFRNTYGNTSSTEFVTLLYSNVLNRTPDTAGRNDWVSRLDDQGWSRAEVVLGFSQSREFQNSTAPELHNWVKGLGTNDVLAGGAGTNVLFGGILSDEFQFTANQGGQHQISDIEAWDVIQLNGFGYTNVSQVHAHLTHIPGGDAIFSDQGVTVTILGAAGQISDEMLQFS